MIAKLFDCLSLIFSKTLIKGYDRFRSTAIYLLRNPFESLVSTKGALAQRYTCRVLQTIQIKLKLLRVWAEWVVLGSAKTTLKFKREI